MPDRTFDGDQNGPHDERTEEVARAAIEEARIVTPGIQALFGFQLIAVFNQRFHDLTPIEQTLHYLALILVALSVAIIMTPAAYHRIAEQGTASRFFVHFASWLIAIAMIPLACALCIDVGIIGRLITGSAHTGVAVSLLLLLTFGALWFAYPIFRRRSRQDEDRA